VQQLTKAEWKSHLARGQQRGERKRASVTSTLDAGGVLQRLGGRSGRAARYFARWQKSPRVNMAGGCAGAACLLGQATPWTGKARPRVEAW
jgi:hypothetical protein